MNTRQIEILKLLLVQPVGVYLLIQSLADKVKCSEKTIRNDLKIIEKDLQAVSRAALIRKPGHGVLLEIGEVEKADLYQRLFANYQVEAMNDQDRLLGIGYSLLMSKEAISAGALAAKYYVNKNVIKTDLNKVRAWLEHMGLTLITKQRIGIMVEGSEKSKRVALSRLSQLAGDTKSPFRYIAGQFSKYEVEIIQSEINQLVKQHSLYLTDDALDDLIIHVLLQIRRVKLQHSFFIDDKDRKFLQDKKEYKWARDFFRKIEIIFVIHFSESEIMYFALQLIGAKIKFPEKQGSSLTHPLLNKLTAALIEEMAGEAEQGFTDDPILQKGLSVHLNTALNRLSHGLDISNTMLPEIKKMYPYLFNKVIDILGKLNEAFFLQIPEEEAGYLTLHFQAAIERQLKNNIRKKKAVIVCHLGIGMSQLLRSKLERKFPAITVTDCIGKADLNHYFDKTGVDLVISTIEVSPLTIPHIVVSPLLSDVETIKLDVFLKTLDRTDHFGRRESVLSTLASSSSIFLNQEKCHRYEIIEFLAGQLYKEGYVAKEYGHYAIARERMSSTAIGSSMAIPHADRSYILKSGLAIATFKEEIDWETEKVSMVIMLALKEEDLERTKQLFHELSSLSEHPGVLQRLISFQDKNIFLSHLNELPELLQLHQPR